MNSNRNKTAKSMEEFKKIEEFEILGPPMTRNVKDSVFGYLFRDKKYQLELYRTLHPDDPIEPDDLKLNTLTHVLVDCLYNDLCLLVKDRLLVFVEAQSTFGLNIAFRVFLYSAWTYQRYAIDKKIDFRRGTSYYPNSEYYVIYTGDDKNVPDEINLSQVIPIYGLPIHILKGEHKSSNDIVYQYVRFCKISNEKVKLFPNDRHRAIKETIKQCILEGVLVEFLVEKEKEVIEAMEILFDQQTAIQNFGYQRFAEGEAKGEAKGEARGIAIGEAKGEARGIAIGEAKGEARGKEQTTLKIAKNMLLITTITLEQIAQTTGLSLSKLKELKKELQ